MNGNLFIVKIIVKFHHIIHDTTRLCTIKYPVLTKMISLGSRLIAYCKLAPTLARQM